MLVYRASDVKLSWKNNENEKGEMGGAPTSCGYVKEGLGTPHKSNIVLIT